ncbi:MAG: glycoside hydrolase family 31 protein [Thalassotalea sp.]|nr:glycoside hydrolase family 31 protein [Thalassotalea sp.]
MAQSVATGLPMQRAMVLAFPEEKQAWPFEDQFMFGEHMLVAPGGNIECYLPEGEWYLFDVTYVSDNAEPKCFQGGHVHRLTLALAEQAVFVRKGQRIPLGEAVEHTEALIKQGNDVSTIVRYWPRLCETSDHVLV